MVSEELSLSPHIYDFMHELLPAQHSNIRAIKRFRCYAMETGFRLTSGRASPHTVASRGYEKKGVWGSYPVSVFATGGCTSFEEIVGLSPPPPNTPLLLSN